MFLKDFFYLQKQNSRKSNLWIRFLFAIRRSQFLVWNLVLQEWRVRKELAKVKCLEVHKDLCNPCMWGEIDIKSNMMILTLPKFSSGSFRSSKTKNFDWNLVSIALPRLNIPRLKTFFGYKWYSTKLFRCPADFPTPVLTRTIYMGFLCV